MDDPNAESEPLKNDSCISNSNNANSDGETSGHCGPKQSIESITVIKTEFKMSLFKKLFDETLKEMMDMNCLSLNQSYTGDHVAKMFKFFKKMFCQQVVMNQQELIKQKFSLSTALSVAASTEPKSSLQQNDQQSDQAPLTKSMEFHGIDVDAISSDGTEIDDNENMDKCNSNHKKTCRKDKSQNIKQVLQSDDNSNTNEQDEFESILNQKISIPNIDQTLAATKQTESDMSADDNTDHDDHDQFHDAKAHITNIKTSTPINPNHSNDKGLQNLNDLDIPSLVSENSDETSVAPQPPQNGTQPAIVTSDIDNLFSNIDNDDTNTNNLNGDSDTQTSTNKTSDHKLDDNNDDDDDDDEKSDQNKCKSDEKKKFSNIDSVLKKSRATLLDIEYEKELEKSLDRKNDKKQKVDSDSDDNNDDDDDDDNNESRSKIFTKKRTKKKTIQFSDDDDESDEHILTSDDDGDDDDDDQPKKKAKKSDKKRLLDDEDDDEDEDDEKFLLKDSSSKKPKKKQRRRVILKSSSSNEDEEEEDDDIDSKDKKDGSDNAGNEDNSTRKKIRKILSNKRLRGETRSAEKAELERRKRIEEKQRLYNSITDDIAPKDSKVDRIILDVDKETKQVLVEVDERLVKVLKPHQVDGIKFMFNCTIETVERLKKNQHESGCILAHSMGLGKTLQVVTFLHTVMNNVHTKEYISKALIILPLNVAKNWANEFYKWFNECDIESNICVYEMVQAKTLNDRMKMLKAWHSNGGVILLTITLFSQLVQAKKFNRRQRENILPAMKQCLLDPGPDIVIVDEGHLLKNDRTAFNNSINQIRTLRRVILTGTPLQNNLSEYYIMVDFVKPNLLGTKKEFKNRFENPIVNGQHTDSTDQDVKIMKKRVHILHKVLQDCIHRCSYNVLVPYLQPKYEFAISIRLTDVQAKMYRYYLNNLTDKCGKNLLNDFSILRLIWNHPASLDDFYRKKSEEEEDDDLKGFVVNSDEDDYSDRSDHSADGKKTKNGHDKHVDSGDSSDSVECVFDSKPHRVLRSQGPAPEISVTSLNEALAGKGWYHQFLNDDEDSLSSIEISSKFIILFSILEQCEVLGDKLLIFSQSLSNLDMIEYMLRKKMDEINDKFGDVSYEELVEKNAGVTHRWYPNIDYFRIDGKVTCDHRHSIVNRFNDEDDLRARLMLVSTKAGGLGINLVGANRCVIFDVSWNPSNDLQAIYRIYRYGQKKPVYIYRFISSGTMENKIYDRQITKQSMARRVIDEQQITRHFKQSELAELYTFTDYIDDDTSLPDLPKDRLLADLFLKHRQWIIGYHEHDSLLENRPEEELTEEERKAAWAEYEQLKEFNNAPNPMEYNPLLQKIYMQNGVPVVNQQTLLAFQQQLQQQPIPQQLAQQLLLRFQALSGQSMLQQQQQQQQGQQPQGEFLNSMLQTQTSSSKTGIDYYRQYYKQKEQQQQQPIQQQALAKTYLPTNINMPPIIISDQTFQNYFRETIHHIRSINKPFSASQYRNCTIGNLITEFSAIFSMKSTTLEWKLRFICYMYVLKMVFKSRKPEDNTELLIHLDKLLNKFVADNNLSYYHNQLGNAIRNMLDNKNFDQPKPPIKSGPVECINLDSDDDQ